MPATKTSKVVLFTEQVFENCNRNSAAGFCACSFFASGFWKMQPTPPAGLSPSWAESSSLYSTMELWLNCPCTMGKFDEGGSKDDLRCWLLNGTVETFVTGKSIYHTVLPVDRFNDIGSHAVVYSISFQSVKHPFTSGLKPFYITLYLT